MEQKKLAIHHLILIIHLWMSLPGASEADKALRPDGGRHKLHAEGVNKNSEALNNFLEDVLRAKDELKWIDQAIYPRVSRYESRKTRRRLLWTKSKAIESRSGKRQWTRRKNPINLETSIDSPEPSDNGNINGQHLVTFGNGNEIETVLVGLELSTSGDQTEEPSTQLTEVPDNVANYKRESSIPASPLKRIQRHLPERKKPVSSKGRTNRKKGHRDILTGKKRGNNSTHKSQYKKIHRNQIYRKGLKQKKSTNYGHDTKKKSKKSMKKHFSDRRQAPFGGDAETDNAQRRTSRLKNIEKQKSRGELARVEEEGERDFINDDPLDLETYNQEKDTDLLENSSTSRSGSDYHELKATDDMFKGGLEQGNTLEDVIYNNLPATNHRSEDDETTLEESSEVNEQSPSGYQDMPDGIEALSHEKLEDDSRGKRSSANLGGVMPHESIVEPVNWPWESYDEKDGTKLHFGRELMQVRRLPDSNPVKLRLIARPTSVHGHSMRKTRSQGALRYLKHPQPSRTLSSSHRENRRPIETSKRDTKHHPNHLNHLAKKFPKENTKFGGYSNYINSQSHRSIDEDIADTIIHTIFQNVNKNQALRNSLTLRRNVINKSDYRVPSSLKRDWHTDEIMKQIQGLLDRLLINEVYQKTCESLPVVLHEFLHWMVADPNSIYDIQDDENLLVTQKQRTKIDGNYPYLFPSSNTSGTIHEDNSTELMNVRKKIQLLKHLIDEYHSLSPQEQARVETIHEYLENQLKILKKYLDMEEEDDSQSVRFYKISLPKRESKKDILKSPFRGKLSDKPDQKRGKSINDLLEEYKRLIDDLKSSNLRDKRSPGKKLLNSGWKIPKIFDGLRNSSEALYNVCCDIDPPISSRIFRDFISSTCETRMANDRCTKVYENATASNFTSLQSDQSTIESRGISSTTSSTSTPLPRALSRSSSTTRAGGLTLNIGNAKIIARTTAIPIIHALPQKNSTDLQLQLENLRLRESQINVLPVDDT